MNKLNEAKEETVKQIESLQLSLNEKSTEIETLTSLHTKENNDLKAELETLGKKIKDLETNNSQIEELEKSSKSAVEDAQKKFELEKDELVKNISRLTEELESSKKLHENLCTEKESLQTQIKSLTEDTEQLKAKQEDLIAENTKLGSFLFKV